MDGRTRDFRIDPAESLAPGNLAEANAYLRIHALSSASDYDPDHVVKILEAHPRLAARMLRIASALAYGVKRPISSIRHAVLLVGARGMREFSQPIVNRMSHSDSDTTETGSAVMPSELGQPDLSHTTSLDGRLRH